MVLRHDLLPWAKYVRRPLLDTRPYCIYEEPEAELYYSQDAPTRKAWNDYCQDAIREWNERADMDKQAHFYYQWTPNLNFREWLRRRNP